MGKKSRTEEHKEEVEFDTDSDLIFEFKLGGKRYEIDLEEELTIGDDPRLAMQDQATKFALYSVLEAKALAKLKSATQAVKEGRSLAEAQIRSGNYGAERNPDNLKLTEDAVKALVRLSPEYQLGRRKEVEAEQIFGILKAAREAFQQRGNMLMYMSADDYGKQLRVLTKGIHESLRQVSRKSGG